MATIGTLATLLVAIFIIVASCVRASKFYFEFVFFAFLFLIFFYLLPFYLAANNGYIYYLGANYYFEESDILNHLFALACFLLGFGVTGLFVMRKKTSVVETPNSHIFSRKFIIPAGIVVLLAASIALAVGLGSYTVGVRTGEVAGNPMVPLLLIFIQCIGLCCLFEADKRRSFSMYLFFAIPIFFLSISLGGRTSVLSMLAMLLLFFRFPLKITIILSIILISVTLPIVLNGKQLIYAIVTGGSLLDVFAHIFNGADYSIQIWNNFGHVFLSFHMVDALIESVGFRYLYDYIQGFLFYLRLFGLNTGVSLTYFNTEIFTGQRISMIPTGYFAFGFVQLGYAGVILSGCFYGLIGSFAEKVKNRLNFIGPMPGFYFAFAAANTFYIGEVRALVLTFFAPMIFIFIISKLGMRRVPL